VRHSEQHQQSALDIADDLTIDGHGSSRDPLHHSAHGADSSTAYNPRHEALIHRCARWFADRAYSVRYSHGRRWRRARNIFSGESIFPIRDDSGNSDGCHRPNCNPSGFLAMALLRSPCGQILSAAVRSSGSSFPACCRRHCRSQHCYRYFFTAPLHPLSPPFTLKRLQPALRRR
jgi:hypothetical protein